MVQNSRLSGDPPLTPPARPRQQIETMMTRYALCILAAFLALAAPAWGLAGDPLPRAKPESVGVSSQKLAEIAVALNREIENKTMPGAVVAIARKGKLVYYEAFGRLDDKSATPMPKNAIFEINSKIGRAH